MGKSLKEAKFLCQVYVNFLNKRMEMDEKRRDKIFNAISKLGNAMDQIATNNFSQKKNNRFL